MCNSKMATIAAAVVTGGLSLAVTGLPGKKKPTPSTPTAPIVPQEMKPADINAMSAANAGAKYGLNAGTASTLLTGGSGVKDPLELSKNKLLGQ